jgi:hypothetical protein
VAFSTLAVPFGYLNVLLENRTGESPAASALITSELPKQLDQVVDGFFGRGMFSGHTPRPWTCGYTWLDAARVHAHLLDQAAHFVQLIEQRLSLRVACPEEIAFLLLLHIGRAAISPSWEYLRAIYEAERKGV